MKKLIVIFFGLSLSLFAHASQEGVLTFSEFTIKSNGIGRSGVVELTGKKNAKSELINVSVNAFGKNHVFPNYIMKKLTSEMINGVQLTYEAGYPSLGGRTIYMQFQRGFNSGIHGKVIVSLKENGQFKILKNR